MAHSQIDGTPEVATFRLILNAHFDQFRNLDEWSDVGQGWTRREDTLRLMGWSKSSRIIVISPARKIDI